MFEAYSHALASVALFGLLVVFLGTLSTRNRNAEDRAACGKPKRNYANKWYRTERAFSNAIENATPFIAGTLVAVLVGASPFWVNLVASIFLVSRIAMAFVHIQTENQGARSACFVVGWLCNIILGVMAITGAIF